MVRKVVSLSLMVGCAGSGPPGVGCSFWGLDGLGCFLRGIPSVGVAKILLYSPEYT